MTAGRSDGDDRPSEPGRSLAELFRRLAGGASDGATRTESIELGRRLGAHLEAEDGAGDEGGPGTDAVLPFGRS
jgi:hypothetical protein